MLLLPNASLEQARRVAERIRVAVQEQPLLTGLDAPIASTLSIGVTTRHSGEWNLAAVLDRANAALYRVKKAGRDRVEISA